MVGFLVVGWVIVNRKIMWHKESTPSKEFVVRVEEEKDPQTGKDGHFISFLVYGDKFVDGCWVPSNNHLYEHIFSEVVKIIRKNK